MTGLRLGSSRDPAAGVGWWEPRGPRRLPCLVALSAALVALCAAVPASAAPVGVAKIAKQQGGPYVEGTLPVNVNRPKDLYFRAISNGGDEHTAELFERVAGDDAGDFHIKWFKNDTNISHDVQTSGHEFTLKFGHPKTFRARVKPLVANPGLFCLIPYFTVDASPTEYDGFFAINHPNACF